MLSSRYLHLHEALGLGPMWLNRAAVFKSAAAGQNEQPDQQPAATVRPIARAVQSAAETSVSGNAARLAAMQAVGAHKKTAAPPTPSTDPAPAAQAAHTALADGLAAFPHTDAKPSEIMAVSICPSTEDSMAGKLFSGSIGVLLDNMLAAIGLQAAQAHKTCWVKSAPVFNPTPEPEQIEAALPQLQQELTATDARVVLFLGQIFESPQQKDLLDKLCGSTPYFIIPHPARLLRQPQLKAQAWAELKKVKQLLNK
ncbi:uracil-DNA glycosylase family protein [Neisseria animalis]|uniref:Uracil-DNA glycosylase n=1 Tax=Neisseria animalis TaxID=492 RepID=A0A5P3MRF6_NEIAN|nr:uracil-DNA glycosylase family protein [Neisseria animalis]QEY24183.1 uracil-DNA glycosylase [Neisseria animalis]ROW32208.1 uracil-DNA glycosylase [Neisseria animalis]VEE06463.1 putative uracil-DNA glycosylase, family 4 [Neisseria animalis]